MTSMRGLYNVEPELAMADRRDAIVNLGEGVEVPIGTLEQKPIFGRLALHHAPTDVFLRSKSSRNTG